MWNDLLAKLTLLGAQLSSLAPRLAIYGLVAAGIFGTGFIKGKAWEQNVQAGAENKVLVDTLAKAQTQARKDSEASIKAASARAAKAASGATKQSKLAEKMKDEPVCRVSEAAQAQINEVLQ